MPPSDAHSTWFLDQTSLLSELKKSQAHRGRAPIIAGYDDLREISRGGQGVVYAATQRSTRRKVAIKVLLDGAFSSNAARRRFEREIDLVASLKHPNIVQVYDSGTTAPPDDRLFFVMEFIDGQPLTDYARRLDLRQKLSLFAEIGDAVNYAHQRGVIHRDLKPSNIRVDSSGRPHVLDFGLAKAAGSSTRDGMTMSISGQFLGSLPWASPEQAEGAMDRIDTRSDVYALGVVLYQLLTDRFPYEVDASFREVLDNILNSEPSRPSYVGSDNNDEIDTIVLKCLAKDPARRYQTAGELAQDVRHYLAGEPIEAKRDSMWYTMRKRLQRYRLLAAAAALLLLALIGGFATTAWQAHKAEQQKLRADEERYRAERRFNDVRKLAHAFIFDFNEQIQDLAGSRPAREALVKTALEYLQSLSSEAGDDDPGLQAELAAAWQQVGIIQGDPFHTNMGDTAGALESSQRALAIRERLAGAEPDNLERQRLLASSLNQIGDIRQFMGDCANAVGYYERAVAALERVLPSDPDNAALRRELAASAMKMGDCLYERTDRTRAREQYQRSMDLIAALHERDPTNVRETINLSVAHSKMGHVAVDSGDVPGALEHYQASLDLLVEQLRHDPNNATIKRNMAISHNDLAVVQTSQNQLDEAVAHLTTSLAISQELADADPGDMLASRDLAFVHNKIAEVNYRRKDLQGALDHYRTALDIREQLAQRDPNNAACLRDKGVSLTMVGSTHFFMAEDAARPLPDRIAQAEQAIRWYQTAYEVFLDMRNRGWLSERDAKMPDAVMTYIENCGKTLAVLQVAKTQPAAQSQPMSASQPDSSGPTSQPSAH